MPQDLTPLLIYPNVPAGLVLRSTFEDLIFHFKMYSRVRKGVGGGGGANQCG